MKNSHNQYSEKVPSALTGNERRIGVVRWLLGSTTNLIMSVRECGCSSLGLILMDIAFAQDIQDKYFPFLESFFRQAKNSSSSKRGTFQVEIIENPSNSSKLKFEKLELCFNQLLLEKRGTFQYFTKMTEFFNLFTDIVRENWDDFPVPLKNRFLQKSNSNLAKFLLSNTKRFLSVIFDLNYDELVRVAFSKNSQDTELIKNCFKSFHRIRSLFFEIQEYGHPLKFKDDRTKKQIQEQIKKNQKAMALIDSWRNEVSTPEEFELRSKSFQIMKEVIDDNRPDEEKVFSSL